MGPDLILGAIASKSKTARVLPILYLANLNLRGTDFLFERPETFVGLSQKESLIPHAIPRAEHVQRWFTPSCV